MQMREQAPSLREQAPSLREHLDRIKADRAAITTAGIAGIHTNNAWPPKASHHDAEYLNQMYSANARAALFRLREKKLQEEFELHWQAGVTPLLSFSSSLEREQKKKDEFLKWWLEQRKAAPRKPLKLHLELRSDFSPKRSHLSKTPSPSKSSTPPGSKRGPTKPPGALKGKGKGKGKGGSAPELDEKPLIPSGELFEQAEALVAKAAENETFAGTVKTATFERRLGMAILDKMSGGKKLEDLVREWDKNGDGDINTIEFRACVRNDLGLKSENKEIDAFFRKMDNDGGGSLDFSELKPTLKALKDASANADKEADGLRAEAQGLRDKAGVVKACAKSIELVELAEGRLVSLQTQPTVEAQLGAAIVARNWKAADIMMRWDADGDGLLSKGEFRQNVQDLGVIGTPDAIDELFDEYDADGGGELDLKELRPTLKGLIESATAANGMIKQTNKSLTELRKIAKKNQKALLAERARELAQAKAKAEAEVARLKAELEAREEAKRLRAEARAAKLAREAAEKAEWEAKIAERRLAQAKAMITEDVGVQARREAQKSINTETGNFDAKKQWRVAGLLAKLAGGGLGGGQVAGVTASSA